MKKKGKPLKKREVGGREREGGRSRRGRGWVVKLRQARDPVAARRFGSGSR